jgi:hypothetical protein
MLERIKTIFLMSMIAASVSADQQTDLPSESEANQTLTVYKSPSCGCCGAWVEHLIKSGITVSTIEDADMASIKNRFDLPSEARSCHTAVKGDYFFEGHVPPALVHSFIQNPPDGAKGLIVPGMPIGSAGMEDGDRFQPYKVWLMRTDGEFEEYASIDTYREQF